MNCERCDGSGYIMGDRGMIECACRVQRRQQQGLERAGIPPRYQGKGFASYDGSVSPSAGIALLTARKYVEEWPTNRSMGLLLTGPVGIGKTHLINVILMECRARWSASVRFADLSELLASIKATFGGDTTASEQSILRPLLEADVLAIDEIGAARTTDWSFDITEKIINARYNADKSTLFTTNYANRPPGWRPAATGRTRVMGESYEAAVSATAIRVDTLGDRIGARMHSRLQEMCLVLEMSGEDQRANAGRRRRG